MSEAPPNSNLIREGMKRAIATGTAAIFMTEEGVRALLGELKLPKDIVRYVTEQAADGRTEFFDMLRKEIRRWFDRYDAGHELRQLLRENTLEISAKVRFVPNQDGQLAPEVLEAHLEQKGSASRRKKKPSKRKSSKKKTPKKKTPKKKTSKKKKSRTKKKKS